MIHCKSCARDRPAHEHNTKRASETEILSVAAALVICSTQTNCQWLEKKAGLRDSRPRNEARSNDDGAASKPVVGIQTRAEDNVIEEISADARATREAPHKPSKVMRAKRRNQARSPEEPRWAARRRELGGTSIARQNPNPNFMKYWPQEKRLQSSGRYRRQGREGGKTRSRCRWQQASPPLPTQRAGKPVPQRPKVGCPQR